MQRVRGAGIAQVITYLRSAPVLKMLSLEVIDEGQLPDSGFSLRRRYIRISGRELHICASRPTRDASASKCAAMFEGLGHERGAHERWSAHSGAAFDCDVQVVRHRALRVQSRLAPDDDADACALTWSEKQGDGLTGRQCRWEWAKDGAKPRSPADRSTSRSTKIRFYSWPKPNSNSPMWVGRVCRGAPPCGRLGRVCES